MNFKRQKIVWVMNAHFSHCYSGGMITLQIEIYLQKRLLKNHWTECHLLLNKFTFISALHLANYYYSHWIILYFETNALHCWLHCCGCVLLCSWRYISNSFLQFSMAQFRITIMFGFAMLNHESRWVESYLFRFSLRYMDMLEYTGVGLIMKFS